MRTEEIDRQIGMPDIDKEWEKFEKTVLDANPSLRTDATPSLPPKRHWLSRAAIIALVCTVGFAALASSLYIYNERPQEPTRASAEVNATEVKATEENIPSDSQNDTLVNVVSTEYLNVEKQEFAFDNAEMQVIAKCLQEYYGVEPFFKNEEVKHIRLYVTLSKKKSIEEVIDLLNHLEVVQLSLKENKLIVE